MKAIQIQRSGGPEVMEYQEVSMPKCGDTQVLVKQKAVGVNFIDVYQRIGLYPVKHPYIPGLEGCGIVEEVGPGVSGIQPGDRVAYVDGVGTYAEYVAVPEDRLARLPKGLDFRQGGAAMLQGMTAHYLAYSTYPLKPGDSCLIHAAAGGVGLLLVQMAKMCGATVFATVSTEQKAEMAKEAGADEVILYTKKDFETEVKALTQGRGVNVVYDSVGKTTFEKSLNCLSPLGYMVLFGQSSGKVDKIDPLLLSSKGSLFLTRPSLSHYILDRPSFEKRSHDVLEWAAEGRLKLHIGKTFALSEAAEAHKSLEARKTTGKVLLIP